MSAGREWTKELYVGFLLLLLTFLYLSHLSTEFRQAALNDEIAHAKRHSHSMAKMVPTKSQAFL